MNGGMERATNMRDHIVARVHSKKGRVEHNWKGGAKNEA